MTKRCCDCEHPQPCEVISCDECRIECPEMCDICRKSKRKTGKRERS